MSPPEIATLGLKLHWAYANLAMLHAGVKDGVPQFTRKHFIIRQRLYSGLERGTMALGTIAHDERLKMVLPSACCYWGTKLPDVRIR